MSFRGSICQRLNREPRDVKRNITWAIVVLGILFLALVSTRQGRTVLWDVVTRLRGRPTVGDRVEAYGPAAPPRLRQHFDAAAVEYPPSQVVFLGLKQERRLDVYAGPSQEALRLIHSYPILRASGVLEPKLREGDRQVPEGFYEIESLNPNSLYHLSLRIRYPNARDRKQGELDGRTSLGGDIMIHGGSASIGCLAMGDPAVEELFVLAADVGIENIRVLLCPVDFRVGESPATEIAWVREGYAELRDEVLRLPRE